MEKIIKELKIQITKDKAFQKFLNDFNEWWPREYTWSRDKLKEITIDDKVDGLCTEIGPHGFRSDWGRVIKLTENKEIRLKWQIGPKREPIPDPEKASELKILFKEIDDVTIMKFVHRNFENHGNGAENYRKMMGGKQGWDYILNIFKKYCER
ncbi:SRPBCC domain-containing protein [Galbibacter sp. PAP.153]|uniref:SRPBCC domain-containing protein n=1 Tax=Galbibacter sp. PAP.153 TaxID=3104623 RepID=UPI003009A3CE